MLLHRDCTRGTDTRDFVSLTRCLGPVIPSSTSAPAKGSISVLLPLTTPTPSPPTSKQPSRKVNILKKSPLKWFCTGNALEALFFEKSLSPTTPPASCWSSRPPTVWARGLEHTATHCNTLQHTATKCILEQASGVWARVLPTKNLNARWKFSKVCQRDSINGLYQRC